MGARAHAIRSYQYLVKSIRLMHLAFQAVAFENRNNSNVSKENINISCTHWIMVTEWRNFVIVGYSSHSEIFKHIISLARVKKQQINTSWFIFCAFLQSVHRTESSVKYLPLWANKTSKLVWVLCNFLNGLISFISMMELLSIFFLACLERPTTYPVKLIQCCKVRFTDNWKWLAISDLL